ncbi:MAG: hypothetical protein QM638_17685 [Nocardioides sp.]|uniref:hypothetical protein n=1 Tax=Nocardioides sp. TaxID=35761 RepID=UPI0039E6CA9A
MNTDTLLVAVATGVLALVVVATYLRLRRPHATRRSLVSPFVRRLHTGAGVIGVLAWIAFLAAPPSSPLGTSLAGVIALFFCWLMVIAGFYLLGRWRESRGRHAGELGPRGTGPVLSALGQVIALAAVLWLTWAYLNSMV